MNGTGLSRTLFAIAIAFLLQGAGPAEAQLFRTWVSSGGSDGNTCSRAQPCATFSGAQTKTNAGGEINCVDAGEYGGLTAIKPLTIDCAGTLAAISAGAVMLVVNVSEAAFPNAVVRLRNLTLNVGGALQDPIQIARGGAEVHIENCVVTGVPANFEAIRFTPQNSLDLFIRDTFIGGNAGIGLLVRPQASAFAGVSLNNVRLDHNGFGIQVDKSNAGTAVVILEDVQIENTTSSAIIAIGAGAFVFMSNSTVTLNGTAFNALFGGKIFSFGNNTVAANAGTDSTPILLQQQ